MVKEESALTHFPALSPSTLLERLAYPKGRIRMVLDTDAYNEIDDQFAIVYALNSPYKLEVEALYAAPFHNALSTGPKDGMEKSYDEINNIQALLGSRVPVFRGSETYLPAANVPVDSDAARDLVERAMASPDNDPLYVVAIGAITNVASALLLEPRIVEKIVLVWLGGHAFHWPNTKEFNLYQDLHASRIVFDSGAPLILIPCWGVASGLVTTLSEIRDYVRNNGPVGHYLFETYERIMTDHYGRSRVIWDISVIAYLLNEAWTNHHLTHSPKISDEFEWIFNPNRHLIRYVSHLHRDSIFQDLFQKIN